MEAGDAEDVHAGASGAAAGTALGAVELFNEAPLGIATLSPEGTVVAANSAFSRLLPSRMANFLISRVTGAHIHDTGCSLKAYRSWVVRSLHLYSDMHRFLAALGAGIGARITELPVRHHARRAGVSKYGLGRVFRVLADLVGIKMLIQFAAHPIRWFTLLALPLYVLSPMMFVLGFVKLRDDGGWDWFGDYDMAAVAAGAVALLVAMNVFLLGFLAELQVKVSKFFRHRVSVTAREAIK